MAVLDAGIAVDTEIREISPLEAQTILGSNTHNRGLVKKRVQQLAAAMQNGEWLFNGDAIRIGESGRLLDGQHRLAALIASETSQQFLVISGLPDSTQETMDSGAKRTVADSMRLRGEKDVNRLAAAVRMVLIFEKYGTMRTPPLAPTTQQVLAYLDRHPGIRESSAAVRTIQKNIRFASGPSGACHYLMSLVDPAETDVFFTRLAQGSELSQRSPIHALRRRLTAPNNAHHPPSHFQAALCIKAWTMWRLGEETDHIRYAPGGGTAEKFPQVNGLDISEMSRR
jgi:hypothetical protein